MTQEATMRAAIYERYGPPEVIRLGELPRPSPGPGELLVRVRATTVNRTDCGYLSGKPFPIRFFGGLRRPKVPVLGTEFAGEVAGLGEGVTGFSVGDRVCGYCERTFGAHGEYMTIAATRLVARIPEGRSFVEAAPSTEGSHYAILDLRAAGLRPGDDLLVYGASGAIGSAAVQLGKSMGLRVTAVCGTAHVDLVKGLGADRVIDFQTEDFTSDEQQYHMVFDAVGKSSFWKCRRLLRPKGVYTSTDLPRWGYLPGLFLFAFAGRLLLVLATRLGRRRRVLFIPPSGDTEGIALLKSLIESGEFRPVVDRTYPLEKIVDAYRYVETGQKVGNVVIEM